MRYVIVTPARDEAACLSETARSVLAQDIRPAEWIIVNDGSRDDTSRITRAYAAEHGWIRAVDRADRGRREPGGGVIEAFYDGYRTLRSEWDFLVKLDADLSFEPDYFRRCFAHFEREPTLGIGGGMIQSLVRGRLQREGASDPPFHVRGATKIYRRACWEAIGGLIRAPGWDTVDELRANMLGWTTRTFRDLLLTQHRVTGGAQGGWRDAVKNGRANYVTGYHPLFMIGKCVKRTGRPPCGLAGVALLWGFLTGYARRMPRIADPNLIRYVRRQQMNRLLFRPSIYG